jgi:hypothetical protein
MSPARGCWPRQHPVRCPNGIRAARARLVTKRYLRRLGLPLPLSQPYLRPAPDGVRLFTHAHPANPQRAFGYDVQVRQAGRLVARVRRAVHCGPDPQFYNIVVCRIVRAKNG